MNSRIGVLRTGLSLAIFMVLAQTAIAVTCYPGLEPSNPDSIYINNGDGTVTDTRTGLMWKRCSEGSSGAACEVGEPRSLLWAEALAYARSHNFAEYTDWRVPNVKELFSLIEDCNLEQYSINDNLFPNDPGESFLSNSPVASDLGGGQSFWLVSIGEGWVADSGNEVDRYPLRLVRDVEPQAALPRTRLSVWMDPEWSEVTEVQCRDYSRSYLFTLFVKEEIGVGVTLEGLDWQIFNESAYSNGSIIDAVTLEQWFGSLYLEPYGTASANLCQVRFSMDDDGAAIHRIYGIDGNGYFVEGSATNYYFADIDDYEVQGLLLKQGGPDPVVDVVK